MNDKITPKIYLDQNVIDYLIKGKLKFEMEKGSFQIIYSMVTLREFERIKDEDNRNLFLNFLKNNNAQYFWVDKDEFAHFQNIDPFECYDEVIIKNIPFVGLENSMRDMMNKFVGGKKDCSYEDILNEQQRSFDDLIIMMKNEFKKLDDDFPFPIEMLNEYADNLQSTFGDLMDKNLSILNNNPEKINKLSEFRDKLNINPSELNNIKPPNIVKQVWSQIESGIKGFSNEVKFDDFFGEGLGKYYPNDKLTMTMKVNGVFNMLNFFGYFADQSIEKERKFISHISDQQHAGLAIYANVFITRDKKMMKKTKAAYELLGISTEVQLIEV